MRRLLALFVLSAVFGFCAPSYGYILAYKVTGKVKAVEWNVQKIISVSVKGYLAVDINYADLSISNAEMVLYGKNAAGGLIYFDETFCTLNSGINWSITGDVVGLDVWDYDDPFDFEFTMIGKVKSVDVGFGVATKETAASSLTGSLGSWWYQLLDNNQELFGTGAASMTLDTKQTKIANVGASSVANVISAFITGLRAQGYNALPL
jgi:hypothetical protein